MHDIEMAEASEEFARCWQAAGRHIQKQVRGQMHSWLKVTSILHFWSTCLSGLGISSSSFGSRTRTQC